MRNKVKKASLLIWPGLLYIIWVSSVSAETPPFPAYVKEPMVNVRSGPSIEASILTRAKQGDRVLIEEVQSNWWRSKLSDGTKGWIHKSVLTTTAEGKKGISDKDIEPQITSGNAFFSDGKYDEAIKEYLQALKLKPDSALAHYNLANAYDARGVPDEAIVEHNRALQLQPNYPEARYNLGLIYFSLEDFEKAIAEWKEAVALKPDYAEAHFNLAVVYERVDEKKALEQWKKYLEVAKDLASHQQMVKRVQEHLKTPGGP
ncbi:MAG: tetratricopeptide repeat protein [Candidatus Tectomicrobia bacterium]|nr:tetratricopeptide repeat protein [Candidatus Tectomicrobia bacterium]